MWRERKGQRGLSLWTLGEEVERHKAWVPCQTLQKATGSRAVSGESPSNEKEAALQCALSLHPRWTDCSSLCCWVISALTCLQGHMHRHTHRHAHTCITHAHTHTHVYTHAHKHPHRKFLCTHTQSQDREDLPG